MDALVSGRGNGALLIGLSAPVWLGRDGRRVAVSESDIGHLLQQRGAFFPMENVKKESEVVEAIRVAHAATEALTCVALLLNGAASERARLAAAEELADHLARNNVRDQLEALLWSGEVAAQANFDEARRVGASSGSDAVVHLFDTLQADQELIRTVRRAWESIPDEELINGGLSRADVFYYFVHDGWFRAAVDQLRTSHDPADLRSLEKKTTRLEKNVSDRALKAWRKRIVDFYPVVQRTAPASHPRVAKPARIAADQSSVRAKFAQPRPHFQSAFLMGRAFTPKPPGVLATRRKAKRGHGPKTGRRVVLRQTRSGIGCTRKVRESLRALGLKGPHQISERLDTPETRGMMKKVESFIEIVQIIE